MSAVSHGTRHLRQGIGIQSKHGLASASAGRSIHTPAFIPRPNPPPAPSTAQRLFAQTRTFFTRFVSHLTEPGLTHSSVVVSPHTSQSLLRPAHYHSSAQSIKSGFSLPVRHALSRPLSAPRLPKPPTLPGNVTHLGLGTARAFHSARPIFQNIVDNVPIATRALWGAEWDVRMKKKEARKMRRAKENKAVVPKSQEMLKPTGKAQSIVGETRSEQADTSELEVYFPLQITPAVTTQLLVPLAPTPTARLPLSTHTAGSTAHPLLPIPEIASTHHKHHLHSLRVSTLFAKLDAANVWDDPGVSVDAYAYGPRDGHYDARERQCTVLRVTFAGWTVNRVRAVVGDGTEGWCTLEVAYRKLPASPPGSELREAESISEIEETPSNSPSILSVELDSASASALELDEASDVDTWDYGLGLSPPPMSGSASSQHEFVLPTLDFSSSFTEAAHTAPPPPQPEIFLRTASELAREAEADGWSFASSPSSLSPVSSLSLFDGEEFPFPHSSGMRPMEQSWDSIGMGLSSSFVQRVGESELSGW
ncbi:hypothetical protein HYDPIDRAFT_113267 [Hydnomerulius pinastri MD-312]|uniref:Uncharacterized protein n=1 Tax=Hydnomerulius pinastri MD-312 TaxID=994086 RepID=A0A0C9W7Q8_9AGAM|nr:hypothetical protein HYDPIDRAFT_113267 [Hydnomerulius pinastri MD-312]